MISSTVYFLLPPQPNSADTVKTADIIITALNNLRHFMASGQRFAALRTELRRLCLILRGEAAGHAAHREKPECPYSLAERVLHLCRRNIIIAAVQQRRCRLRFMSRKVMFGRQSAFIADLLPVHIRISVSLFQHNIKIRFCQPEERR